VNAVAEQSAKTDAEAAARARALYEYGPTSIYSSKHDPRFPYCLYVPPSLGQGGEKPELIVAMHGTGRGFTGYRDAFSAFARWNNCIILAPLFPIGVMGDGYRDGFKYMREGNLRYDHVLLAIVEEVAERYGIAFDRFGLFGYSGGGHFTHRFLMLARDGAGLGADEGKPIVYKSVLLVDTRQATNLAGTAYETATTSLRDARGELRPGIRTAAWKPLVDLLDPADLARFGLSVDRAQPGRTMLSEKWEAMDLVSALDPAHPDDWFLIVGNDNDFVAAHCVMDGRRCDSAFDNDNRILVYRLTLPGMRSTAAPNP